jgi:hypothetical protein
MNKFEQLIEYVINDEEAKARELFHDIVVEKSRQIYENLMSEEAVEEELDESEDEIEEEVDVRLLDDSLSMTQRLLKSNVTKTEAITILTELGVGDSDNSDGYGDESADEYKRMMAQVGIKLK